MVTFQSHNTNRFTLKSKNKYTTRKGQQAGFGNNGMSDEGIRLYKNIRKEMKSESREERLGIMVAWDEWTAENGIDIEWKRKRKVRREVICRD